MADTKKGRKSGMFRTGLIGTLFCMIFMLLLVGCRSRFLYGYSSWNKNKSLPVLFIQG